MCQFIILFYHQLFSWYESDMRHLSSVILKRGQLFLPQKESINLYIIKFQNVMHHSSLPNSITSSIRKMQHLNKRVRFPTWTYFFLSLSELTMLYTYSRLPSTDYVPHSSDIYAQWFVLLAISQWPTQLAATQTVSWVVACPQASPLLYAQVELDESSQTFRDQS